MSLKLVDYESLNGDVKKYHYAIRGSLLTRKLLPFLDFPKSKGHILSGENQVSVGSLPDSGEREFRSVLGPTRNKLQRKLPEMKLKKKKKHMKSKYEKPKKLGTLASPTTTLKQRQTQKRRKLFVAQARSQGITMSRTVDAKASLLLPDFSVVSNVFKKKQDSEQSTTELALEKKKILFIMQLGIHPSDDDDDITVEQAWDDIVQRVKDCHPEQGLSNIPYTLLILFENRLIQENTLIHK
ncbi:hypothetical protein Bca101_039084 [Brassica carinata]